MADDGIRVRPIDVPEGGDGSGDSSSSNNNNNNNGGSADAAAAASGPCFDCSICLDVVSNPVVTPCGHLYCWSCLREWLSTRESCPVCKAKVTADTVIPLYVRGGSQDDPRKQEAPRPRPERAEADPPRENAPFFNMGLGGFGFGPGFHGGVHQNAGFFFGPMGFHMAFGGGAGVGNAQQQQLSQMFMAFGLIMIIMIIFGF
eukprot:m.197451 g.197451  ORF g.197451 m.197451 type:complete len:202 (+) comp17665_c0_seq1:255-860(+)